MGHEQVIYRASADLDYIRSRWRTLEIVMAELLEPTRGPSLERTSNVAGSSSVEVLVLARESHVRLWTTMVGNLETIAAAAAQTREVIRMTLDSPMGRDIAASIDNTHCDGRGLPGFEVWGERAGCSNPKHGTNGLCLRCDKRLKRWQANNRQGVTTR